MPASRCSWRLLTFVHFIIQMKDGNQIGRISDAHRGVLSSTACWRETYLQQILNKNKLKQTVHKSSEEFSRKFCVLSVKVGELLVCSYSASLVLHFLTGFQALDLLISNLFMHRFIHFTKTQVHTCYVLFLLWTDILADSGCIMYLFWLAQYCCGKEYQVTGYLLLHRSVYDFRIW